MNFDPFRTFNYNSTNGNEAFKGTLEMPIVKPDLIYSS